MPAELCIPLQLTPAQARAYLRWLAAQYRAGLQEHWWDDRYRTVPAGPLRRWRIHHTIIYLFYCHYTFILCCFILTIGNVL